MRSRLVPSRLALALLAPVALVYACSEFKSADDNPDAQTSDPADATTFDGPSASNDGGTRDALAADTAPSDAKIDTGPPCDGPCPPELVGTSGGGAEHMIVDATNLYWFDTSGAATVRSCAKTGCLAGPTILAEGAQTTGLASDGTNLYWGDFTSGKIQRCAIAGCAKAPTAIAFGQTSVEGLTMDGNHLYWAASLDAGAIFTCTTPSCGTPVKLADNQGFVLALGAETSTVFWATLSLPGQVSRCAAAGCANTPGLVASARASTIAVVNGFVYFVDVNTKAIARCPTTGCVGPAPTIGTSLSPGVIASDGVEVFWRDNTDSNIYACPVGGCAGVGQRVVATKQSVGSTGSLAVDGLYVYWSTGSKVWRTPKK
jgi:hypothetical protein